MVRDMLSFVGLCECPFSEGFLDWFEVYLREPGEYAVLPGSFSEKSVKMRMEVSSLTGSLYGKDSGEFGL
jgi:hypothetical protein